MFACVYFEKDASLTVVHQEDKDLSVLGTFEKGQLVKMKWRLTPSKPKETFTGVIIKVEECKDVLEKFATGAYNAILKGRIIPGTSAPDGLFKYEQSSKITTGKREHVPTKKLEESRQQDEELGTPKKKKKKTITTAKETADKVESAEKNVTQRTDTVESAEKVEIPGITINNLFKQFRNNISDSSSENINSMVTSTSPQKDSSSSKQTYVHTDTNLSDTGKALRGAFNLLNHDLSEGNDMPGGSTSQFPVVTPGVLETLRGMAKPEFVSFVQNLCSHMESSSCSHTCLKSIFDKDYGEKLYTTDTFMGSRSFLSELRENPDSSFNQIQQNVVSQQSSQVGQQSTSYPISYTESMEQHHQNTLCQAPNSNARQEGVTGQEDATGQEDGTGQEDATGQEDVPQNTPCQTPNSNTRQEDVPQNKPCQTPNSNTRQEDVTVQEDAPQQENTPRRTSPRKKINFSPSSPECADQVKLLPTSQLTINRQKLRKACHTATKKKDNAAFHLMYGMLSEVFTLEELAYSRGLGIGKVKAEDLNKPILDKERISVLKEYVNSWCKKNLGLVFPDKTLNDAVTERSSYARKQLKKKK